jgi:hypothetical protein
MIDKAFAKIIDAIGTLVKPIVRLALRNGMTFRQFSELCKRIYVDVAASDYGVGGRETNISRIALMTGINRKDIKRLKDDIGSGEPWSDPGAPDRISRILGAWHREPPFISSEGMPLDLPLEGEVSFSSLVSEYGGDIAVVTLVREFKRSGVVEELPEGNLRVLKRHFVPNPHSDPQLAPGTIDAKPIAHASSILNDHVNTIFHNLYREQTDLPARFERRVTNYMVDKSAVDDFHEYIAVKGQQLLEDIDDWLNAHQADENNSASKPVRLGFGTYWIQDEKR